LISHTSAWSVLGRNDLMPKPLNYIQRVVRGEFPPPPVAELIGFKLISVTPGQAIIEFESTERHANANGTLHGGVLCDIADAAMGAAYLSTLEEDEKFTTLELKINFLKPVRKGILHAVGKVVKEGRMIGFAECEVLDDKNQLVAKASSTCMTLRSEQA